MALSKFNKSLSQPVDSKKQNDEIMKAMLVQQAQNASIIKDKVSHLELRQDMDFKTDLQGALGEADGKRAKITKDEVESKKVKEVIGLFQDNPELQAMIKLAFKVDNHIWNPQGEEGFEIVEGPELFTQCMLELYQCYEVFNRTRSYSKAKRDEEAKSALESQYKLRVFEILKDNFKDEHEAYEAGFWMGKWFEEIRQKQTPNKWLKTIEQIQPEKGEEASSSIQ